jgi:hypothetical protein
VTSFRKSGGTRTDDTAPSEKWTLSEGDEGNNAFVLFTMANFVKLLSCSVRYIFRGIHFSGLLTSNKAKCYKLQHHTCSEC